MITLLELMYGLWYESRVLGSRPSALPLNARSPGESALYIIVYVAAPPPKTTVAAEGTGPETIDAEPMPIFVRGISGAVFIASVPPVFETIMITVIYWPTEYV